MGNLIFENKSRNSSSCGAIDSAKFFALCSSLSTVARQLENTASSAAVNSKGGRNSSEEQEAIAMMMMGSFAAIENIRRQLYGS